MPVVSAISCKIPKSKINNDYFFNYHDEDYVIKSNNLTGVKTRYWSSSETTLSMCVDAANDILKRYSTAVDNKELRSEIDLLIFITQTPDVMMPAISYQAHDLLELSDECSCLTLNAGCTSYVEGINLAFELIEMRGLRNVLLLVGDQLSKYLNIKDFSTASVFGDAGSATLISNSNNNNDKILFLNGKIPNSSGALELELPSYKTDNFLKMDGFNVFTFAINNIPKIIAKAELEWEEKYSEQLCTDLYLLHQANNMITNHVAKKMKISSDKIPSNISKYGNTSGVTIPLLICTLNKQHINEKVILLCGFGVGLSWSVLVMNNFKLDHTNVI